MSMQAAQNSDASSTTSVNHSARNASDGSMRVIRRTGK